MKFRLSSPGDGVVEVFDAGVAEAHVMGSPAGAKCFAAGFELADEVGEVAVVGVAPGGPAQDCDAFAGGAVPVVMKRLSLRIEEHEPGVVRWSRRVGVQLGEQRAAELVRRQDVETGIADVCGGVRDRVQRPLNFRPDPLPGLAATRPGNRWLCGAGEVEEMGALGVVELERASKCLQHVRGGAIHVSALEPGVVRNAHPGEHSDLFAS